MKKILFRLLLVIGGFILILVLNLFLHNVTASRITMGTPITSSGSGHTTLLVIDIQEGTTGGSSITDSYKKQSNMLIRNINRIITEAHEKKWSVIYIQSEVVNPLINLLNNTMARGSEGAKLDKRLAVSSDLIVTKRKNDSFNRTNLDQILEAYGTERVVVVGLDAVHCIKSTIIGALNRGYQVAVIPEGIITEAKSDKLRILEEYQDLGVKIID
ncbi:MAG: cysteine hydrolase [Bacteroidetes bacterium]|nr:cysteine hydrolase [Bacteroidota bacterium]